MTGAEERLPELQSGQGAGQRGNVSQVRHMKNRVQETGRGTPDLPSNHPFEMTRGCIGYHNPLVCA